jgi:hypothetical protein
MNVKIKELPESLALNDADVFPIDKSTSATAKVSINTLKQHVINSSTTYVADENTITLDEATNTFSVKNVFLPLSGGTMTGYFSLFGPPTQLLHPVNKGYVDTLIGELDADGSLRYVKIAGDVMTGPLRVQSTVTTTGKLSSSGGLDVTGTTTIAGTLSTAQNITTATSLNVGTTLDVTGESTFRNSVEFLNNKIKHFTANVKTISLGSTPPNNIYTLTLDDNGAILSVSGTGSTCQVICPGGLPVGFNVLLIQNSSANVYVLGVDGTSLVTQIDGHVSIRKQYGMCNIVSIATNLFVIAGDLS